MPVRVAFVLLLPGLCVVPGYAQTPGAVMASAGSATYGGSFSTSTMQFNTPAIAGAPYSAEQDTERVQTLGDGTHITQTGPTQRMWRDSLGRTRTERQMGTSLNANAPKPPMIVEIRDPVAGFAYILDTQGKVAHRIKLQPMTTPAARMAAQAAQPRPAQAPPVRTAQAAPDPNRPAFTSEDLGTQVIEGLTAQGRRTTTTYPVGSQGNDRPLVSVMESWNSNDLKLQVLSKSSDPRNGDSTTKLTNVSRIEPDPMLFMPPADYSVVDETGPQVTIRYGAQ